MNNSALDMTERTASIMEATAKLISFMEKEDPHNIVDEMAARAHRLLDEEMTADGLHSMRKGAMK